MPDDLMRDIKDIRLEQERGKLTKFKVWYLLILIIVAGGVGFGLWWYISGQDMSWLGQKLSGVTNQDQKKSEETVDTTSWKTYTDTDLGFAFKYPWDWDIDVQVTKATGAYSQISIVRVNPDVIVDQVGEAPPEVNFWVSVYNMKYKSYIVKRTKDKNFSSQKSETATLSSAKGTKFIFESKEFGGKQQQNDFIFSLDAIKTISLSYFTGTEEAANITSILKSFRFNK
jgi:hypothetical protein